MEFEELFCGRYNATLDNKGRASFPVDYRKRFNDGFIYTMYKNGNLTMFPSSHFEENARRYLANEDILIKKEFFSRIKRLKLDKAGRILITEDILERIGCNRGGKVVFSGAGDVIVLEALLETDED